MKKIVSCFIVFLVFVGFNPNVSAATSGVNSEVSYSANGIDYYDVGEDEMIPWRFNGAQINPGSSPGIFSTQVKLLSQNQQSGVAMVMVDLSTLDNTDAERRNPSEMELEVFLNGTSLGKYQVGELFSHTNPYLDPSVRMIGVPFSIEGEIGDINTLEIHVSLPVDASNASRVAEIRVNASFTPIESYTVSYVDGVENEVVFEDQTFKRIEPGATTPTFGEEPTRKGYTFAGWSPTVSETVTSNAIYTAIWEPVPTYQVNYTDGVENQTVFDNQVFSDLTKGVATPAFSGTPSREGYKFIGWTPTVSEFVEGDMTYTAQWEKLPKIIEPVSPPIKQAEVKKVSETVKTTEITKAITKVMNKEQVTYTKTPINHSRKVRQLPKTAEQSMYSNILVGLGMIIVFIVAIYWLKRSKSEGSR
ncbi:LPXTG cell wall anchor domain-containing protein [Enterococcus mundtii]|uniref:LPXTG cell wall anchor domain-containing protein n=1 Tax=Enterococcus mundtii TaxID=53346 RepID=UPI000D3BE9BA|nr:LPXTG cell wall anchor domain-containing protein [Enterococcus mundtii]PTO37237.1 hypothetical protein C6P50_13490 [Enterococcus mundtii]